MSRLSVKQKGVIRVVLGLILAICLVLELGQRYPESGLPSWSTVMEKTGLSTATEGQLDVHVIDVGNADCLLIRQGDQAMLIDAGESGDADMIIAYLTDHDVRKLDFVIATHPHADHIGSMTKILKNVPVSRFVLAYMPEEATPTTSVYLTMLETLDDKQIPVDEATVGAVYSVGDARLEILAPREDSSDCNDMSVVTKLTFGSTRFLFMGDAGTEVEKQLLSAGADVSADVLKVAHHGSSSATSKRFLQAVNPSFAVVPCGGGNRYGHPHEETVNLLNQYNISTYRSDDDGTVVFSSDGTTVTVQTEKGVA